MSHSDTWDDKDRARETSAHASEATLYDSMGAAGMAIHHYREGICALRILLAAHLGTCLRRVYEARCDSYRYRIDTLKRHMARDRTPA